MMRSHWRPSSASDAATFAPLRPIALVAALRISKTQTSNLPFLSTWPAIGSPISPQPTKPTFIMIPRPSFWPFFAGRTKSFVARVERSETRGEIGVGEGNPGFRKSSIRATGAPASPGVGGDLLQHRLPGLLLLLHE